MRNIGQITYLTGGAKSGKSSHAERQIIQENFASVAYIATQGNDFQDAEIRRSIAKHRQSRPQEWTTYESYQNLDQLIRITQATQHHDAYLLDCVTLWVNNQLFMYLEEFRQLQDPSLNFDAMIQAMASSDWDQVEQYLMDEFDKVLQAMKATDAQFWIVSNEVGSGIVPENTFVRMYRIMIGKVNQKIAAYADKAYVSISGILLTLK